MTFTVTENSGMPVLMHDGRPVAYLDDDRLSVSPMFAERAFGVLRAALAPDEATVIHLARVLQQNTSNPTPIPVPDDYCDAVRYVLAALGGTDPKVSE